MHLEGIETFLVLYVENIERHANVQIESVLETQRAHSLIIDAYSIDFNLGVL